LERIIRTVEVRTTPFVIAQSLQWVAPQSVRAESQAFESALQAWRQAKSSGDITRTLAFYAADFSSGGKSLLEWTPRLRKELEQARGRGVELKDLTYLRWQDNNDTMVVTFGEVLDGSRSGSTKRQYWVKQGPHWKIFFEGTIG
jgi:L,D-transpeptidase YnhG